MYLLPPASSAIELTDEIGVAASARVGNLIGARDAAGAKRASHVSAFLSVVVGSVVMTVMLATRTVSALSHMPVICLLNRHSGLWLLVQ